MLTDCGGEWEEADLLVGGLLMSCYDDWMLTWL